MIKEEIQQFLDDSSGSGCLAVIDLDTCELHSWDRYRCMELGIPEGYSVVDDMTTADWIFLFQALKLRLER